MGLHQVGAFSSFQANKSLRYFFPDSSADGEMTSVCKDLYPDNQYKLQPPVNSSGGLSKILVELQQWPTFELWRQICFSMLLLFWALFLSCSLFTLILQKIVSAKKMCTIKLNKTFKPLFEIEANRDLGYPEYTLCNHRLKFRILLE